MGFEWDEDKNQSTIEQHGIDFIDVMVIFKQPRLTSIDRRRDSDIPELGDDFWEHAEVKEPEPKKSITLRLDADVLNWLKSQGKGYQTRINAILRSYYEAHKKRA